MEKKLPKVFANQIDKVINNNATVYYGHKDKEEDRNVKTEKKVVGQNVNQKINNIFNSPNYIYKADVEITIKGQKVIKRIIGKNNTHLITFENELIALSDIQNIDYAK